MADHNSEHDYAPVMQKVDTLIRTAIAQTASDVHLEPTDKGLRVRFRIDGILYDHDLLDVSIMAQVLSRLKVLAHINIAEKRVPQDGKFIVTVDNKSIDLRVSTFPCLFGEKMVVRILDRSHNMLELDKLGFSQSMFAIFNELISKSSGFFLVTGPTGSGKTTTLYATLSALNSPEKNIITLEDPVEYNVEGITQGQINPDAGFTFRKGMRALVRQDPDIVMIGEMRDKQTAQIAIQAALTGHLVLSTVHTNNAPSVIMRLMDMGIEPFLINAAISCVLAQRLARKICTECRVEKSPTDQEQHILHQLGTTIKKLYHGEGCNACLNLGYKGRIGIFELLVMSEKLRSLLIQQPFLDVLYAQALDDGMHTLLHDGMHKVNEGIITLPELVRVVL